MSGPKYPGRLAGGPAAAANAPPWRRMQPLPPSPDAEAKLADGSTLERYDAADHVRVIGPSGGPRLDLTIAEARELGEALAKLAKGKAR